MKFPLYARVALTLLVGVARASMLTAYLSLWQVRTRR